MKKFRTTYALLALLIVLLLVYLFFGSDMAEQRRTDSEVNKQVLKSQQVKSVDEISFTPVDGSVVLITKSDDGIWLVDSTIVDADESAKLTEALLGFSQGKLVSKSKMNWEKYGLNDENVSKIEVKADGELLGQYFFGNPGPSYTTVYVRRNDQEEVYSVDTDLDEMLQYDVDRWKNKHLFALDQGKVRSMTVRLGEERFLFEKQDSKWMNQQNGEWKAVEDVEAFDTYFNNLFSLKAMSIESDESLFVAADNAVSIQLDDGAEYVVAIDRIEEQKTYARITHQTGLLQIPDDLSSVLRPTFIKIESDETPETSLSTETTAQ